MTQCALVTVKISARKVTCKGRRGEVTKDFGHIPCEIQLMKQECAKRKGTWIRFRMWFGAKKTACSVRTLRSLIKNMIVGVHEVSTPINTASLPTPVVSRCEYVLFQFNNNNPSRATSTR